MHCDCVSEGGEGGGEGGGEEVKPLHPRCILPRFVTLLHNLLRPLSTRLQSLSHLMAHRSSPQSTTSATAKNEKYKQKYKIPNMKPKDIKVL